MFEQENKRLSADLKGPSIQELRVLLAVGESVTLGQAAERVGRTANAVSASVKKLEDYYGCTLVNRARKGGKLSLTAKGSAVRRQALRVAAVLDDDADTNRTIIQKGDLSKVGKDRPVLDRTKGLLIENGFAIDDVKETDDPLISDGVLLREEAGRLCFHAVGKQSTWGRFIGGERSLAAVNMPCSVVGDVDEEVGAGLNLVLYGGEPIVDHISTEINTLRGSRETFMYHRLVSKVQSNEGPLLLVCTEMAESAPIQTIDTAVTYPLDVSQVGHLSDEIKRYLLVWGECKMWNDERLTPFHDLALCAKRVKDGDALVVYRVGDRHGACVSLGMSWRDKLVGEFLEHDSLGDQYNCEVSRAYFEVLESGVPSYDFVFSKAAEGDGTRSYVSYFRLITRCLLDDGKWAVIQMATVPKQFSNEEDATRYMLSLDLNAVSGASECGDARWRQAG